jgi:hypothetical protein
MKIKISCKNKIYYLTDNKNGVNLSKHKDYKDMCEFANYLIESYGIFGKKELIFDWHKK